VTLGWVIYGWRNWTKQIFTSQYQSAQRKSWRQRLLRASNVLMFVGATSDIYWGLHKRSNISGLLFG
jgi:hypothetical protein